MDKRVCSFTGHRVIKPQHERSIIPLLDRAIAYAYDNGCREFLSGGAIGFDTLAAREVLKFRLSHPDVRLLLILPCVNQDERWTERQRSSYYFLLSSADEIIYAADEYTPTCIKERNGLLASRADILISYVSRYNSGAAQTVRIAEGLGKTVYNLYPTLERELASEEKR